VVNLLNVNTMIPARLKADGTLVDAVDCSTSDFIPVKPNQDYTVYVAHNATTWAVAVFYDSNKNVISAINGDGTTYKYKTITTPTGTAYMRYAIWYAYVPKNWREEAMVAEGSVYPSKYVPHVNNITDLSGNYHQG